MAKKLVYSKTQKRVGYLKWSKSGKGHGKVVSVVKWK